MLPKVAQGGLTPALYNKLHQNIVLMRLYFILWFVTVLPNFVLTTDVGPKIYSIFQCFHPIAIIILVLRGLRVNAETLEGRTPNGPSVQAKGADLNDSMGTEMSDQSSIIDGSNLN